MAEFFRLSTAERLDALNAVADISGLPPHLLEKDIWVVWSLHQLFTGPYAEHLVFKGGTSLSKAYGVIRRFSEDVDLTYDIRAIAGDLVGDSEMPCRRPRARKRSGARRFVRACRTGEPSDSRVIRCDAAVFLDEVKFPTATPQVMRAERTFWEKATAIHVFCAQGVFRGGDRFARHWHDLTRLDAAGFAEAAIADKALCRFSLAHRNLPPPIHLLVVR